jgi:hypothetical protein
MLSSHLRGGMSFASQRYCESAVFEEMSGYERTVDEEGRFNILLDIDANNLYGCSQTFPLPYADFKFLTAEEKSVINWSTVDLMGDTGYFVEVTLNYPDSIREKTKSYPLCPENIEIKYDMLSPYQKAVLKAVYNQTNYKEKKLTATFNKREKVVLHALNLQLYVQLGMEIVEVFRVISFKQSPYMKKWVDFCTEQRAAATNAFQISYWKLVVNCVYGKCIESVLGRRKAKIVTDAPSFVKLVRKPTYDRHVIVNPNIAIVFLHPTTARVKRPYYIGYSILELSKLIMYEFYYKILQPYFGEQGISLKYSDTDSLVINVKTRDIHKDLEILAPNMDFSNLHPTHELYSDENKAKLFKFKEEFALKPISRLCALKSKVYAFELACQHEAGFNRYGLCKACNNLKKDAHHFNKLKGIQKRTAKNITFKSYLKCLEDFYSQRNFVYQITSKQQKVTTNLVHKISLSSFDDKRYIFNCGVHSEPYSNSNSPFCPECRM